MNERIKKLTEKIKNPKILMIAGFAGIALIAISALFPSQKSEKTNNSTDSAASDVRAYKAELESGIKDIVTKITGSEDVSVMITLESGVKYVYADDTKDTASTVSGDKSSTQSTTNSKSYITVKSSDGGEKALIVTESMPEIRGAAIICSGGDNEEIAEKINNAVCAALDITSKRVYIAGGK